MSSNKKYRVTGMTCGHCVNHVTEEVTAIDGVENVEIDLASGDMTVTSATEIPFATIAEAVSEAGDYTVVEQ